MKPTAYIVNTARGPIIDEGALLEALQQKKIAGAGIDVFSVEPLPVDHPFRKLDNIVLTPHLGYVTEEVSATTTARWSRASTPGSRASRCGGWRRASDEFRRLRLFRRCERSEPRRMSGPWPSPFEGRAAHGRHGVTDHSDSGLLHHSLESAPQAASCVVARLATSANPCRHD